MRHEINLDSYPIHTDLAIDIIENKSDLEGVKKTIKTVSIRAKNIPLK